MSDITRSISLILFTAGQAAFLTLCAVLSEKALARLISRWISFLPIPLYFRIIKYTCVFLGQCVGVWFFWVGFGVGMSAGNHESAWVMTFAYTSLWPVIPVVVVSYSLPIIGGLALIGDAFWSHHLLRQIFLNPASLGVRDQIFMSHNDQYDLWLTQASTSGPILLIGVLFLSAGLIQFFVFGRGRIRAK